MPELYFCLQPISFIFKLRCSCMSLLVLERVLNKPELTILVLYTKLKAVFEAVTPIQIHSVNYQISILSVKESACLNTCLQKTRNNTMNQYFTKSHCCSVGTLLKRWLIIPIHQDSRQNPYLECKAKPKIHLLYRSGRKNHMVNWF